jgi:hypothetical protein
MMRLIPTGQHISGQLKLPGVLKVCFFDDPITTGKQKVFPNSKNINNPC